eukprot:PhM_4_TR18626/c3_g3_i1/m.27290
MADKSDIANSLKAIQEQLKVLTAASHVTEQRLTRMENAVEAATKVQKRPRDDQITTVFDDGGKFPATCVPPTAAAPTTPLSFIIPSTTDGPWCFEPQVTQRIIRNYEYPLLWQRLEDMRSKQNPIKGMLIMGHPGIGKTLLLDTLLSWNLHAYPTQPVIVIAVGGVTVFTNMDGKTPKRYFG